MATYGPGIDQSQHMKSISHIINILIATYLIALLHKHISNENMA